MTRTAEQRAPITVVGAGHFLIAHDRVGPRVLELARGRYGDEVELCEVGTMGLALLDHIHHQDLLVVVDACTLGGEPGAVLEVVPDLTHRPGPVTSAHQIGPLETLIVAKQLFAEQLPRRILLLLVETEGIGEETQEQACQRALEVLDREVEAWRSGQSGARRHAAPPELSAAGGGR